MLDISLGRLLGQVQLSIMVLLLDASQNQSLDNELFDSIKLSVADKDQETCGVTSVGFFEIIRQ